MLPQLLFHIPEPGAQSDVVGTARRSAGRGREVEQFYRGHMIRLFGGSWWRAQLVELRSGVMLPTTVTATPEEGSAICVARARALIDLYMADEGHGDRRRRHGDHHRPRLV